MTSGLSSAPSVAPDVLGRHTPQSQAALRLLAVLLHAAADEARGVTVRSIEAAWREAGLEPSSKSHAQRVLDGDVAPSGAHVAVLLEHVGAEAVAAAAARLAGGSFSSGAPAAGAPHELLVGLAVRSGAVLGEVQAALADGFVDESERRRIRGAVDGTRAHLDALDRLVGRP